MGTATITNEAMQWKNHHHEGNSSQWEKPHPPEEVGDGVFPIVVYFVINNSKNYKTPSSLLLAKCKYHNLSSTLFSSTRTVQTFQKCYIQSKQVPSKKDEAVQSRKLQKKKFKVIHLIPKWRPINYSFVCMLIIKNKRILKMRQRGLINMQTKV